MASQLEQHRPLLRALCYRMLGSVADAEDAVQETFARALTAQPQTDRPLKPWLVRVALNHCRDALRRRKRQAYPGPWLPSPLPEEGIPEDAWPEARYGLRESAGMAFLCALELLTPRQRAVLLLMDVMDQSVAEVAAATGLGHSHVKVLHHRARKALNRAQGPRIVPTAAVRARTWVTLQAFLAHLAAGRLDAAEALLSPDVTHTSDGGGVVAAARKVVRDRQRVVAFMARLNALVEVDGVRLLTLNGLPGVLFQLRPARPHFPATSTLQIELGEDGLIRSIYSVLAPAKLAGVA